MTIRNLEIFVEVCKHMNMSKTAQNMMISQSSVSQAIHSLENEYGIRLFERLNHSLFLTNAGKQMLYLSAQILKNIEQLDTRMKDASFCNTLSIGVCTTIGNCLIHPLLEHCRSLYPDTRILVEITNSKALEKKLLSAKLDLAIVQRTKRSPYLEHIPILEDQLAIICPKNHPLAGKTVELRELEQEVFIGREKGSGTEMLLEHAFSSSSLSLNIGWVCNSIETVKQAVLHNAGIAAISSYLVQPDISSHQMGMIQVRKLRLNRQFDLVFHKDKIRDTCFQQFVDTCTGLGMKGMDNLILNALQASLPETPDHQKKYE